MNDEMYQLWDEEYEDRPALYVGEPVMWDYDDGQHKLWLPAAAAYRMSSVPGKRKRGDHYTIPGRAEHVGWLRHVFGDALQISDEAFNNLVTRDPVGLPEEALFGLRSDQREDVIELFTQGANGVLAHDTGLGKTIMAIAWMKALYTEDNPVFAVVGPPAVLGQWSDRVEEWWPEAEAYVIPATPKKDREKVIRIAAEVANKTKSPTVLLISYHSVPSLTALKPPYPGVKLTAAQKKPKLVQELGLRLRGLVVDEAHWITKPKNVRSMAVGALAAMADYKLPMSATLVDRASDEAWASFNMVDPVLVGSRGAYRDVFADMQTEWHGGLVNRGFNPHTVELHQRIFGPIYHRRSKQELRDAGILPDRLPVKYLDLPLTPEQEKQYVSLEEKLGFRDGETGQIVTATNGMVRDQFLRMSAVGHLTIEDRKIAAITSPSNKLAALLDIMDEEEGKPLLIAVGPSRKAADFIYDGIKAKRRKLKIARFVGGRKMFELHDEARDFQAGKYDHIIVQAGVGAEGIDMFRSSHVVFVMEDWSRRVNEQIIGRVDRPGQTEPINTTVLMSEFTLDYRVRQVNEGKMELAEVLNEDGLNMEDYTYGALLNRRVAERGRR